MPSLKGRCTLKTLYYHIFGNQSTHDYMESCSIQTEI
jgi:hypothetical protein